LTSGSGKADSANHDSGDVEIQIREEKETKMMERPINRRVFVKGGALALLAMGLPPEFVTRSLLAETKAAARKKTLICIFQRGAADGLSMVVPFGDAAYYRGRRSIAIASPARANAEGGALDLDGFFGLHPSLRPLHELYGRREMAVVHATGSPHPTRSHFEAQDVMEAGATERHPPP
jgi:uncharacterized protein (DUF1501 family)